MNIIKREINEFYELNDKQKTIALNLCIIGLSFVAITIMLVQVGFGI